MPFCYYFHATVFLQLWNTLRSFLLFAWLRDRMSLACHPFDSNSTQNSIRLNSTRTQNSKRNARERKKNTKRMAIREIIDRTVWHWMVQSYATLLLIIISSLLVSKPLYNFVVIMKHFEFISSSYVAVSVVAISIQLDSPRDPSNGWARVKEMHSQSAYVCVCVCCYVCLCHVWLGKMFNFCTHVWLRFGRFSSDVQRKMKINTKQARENRY